MKEVKKIRKQAITLAITFLFVLIFAGAASAANVTVGPDSTYNYQAIQSAVDASADSDTITVYPNGNDVYNENVIVNKLLNIVANSSDTVVNGSFTITATGSGSTVQGFTINGSIHSVVIYLDGASNVKIIGNTINGFNSRHGIYAYNSNSNTLTGNNINGCANGIYLIDSINNMLTGNNVLANTIVGIYLDEYSSANTLFNNTVNNNHYGIYLYYYSNFNYLVENTVANNDHGITLDASTGNTLQKNTITNNQGYGLWSNYYGNTIIENTIMNNNYGIGLNNYVNNGVAETINFNRIYNNTIYNLENRLTANGIPDATYNWWGTNSQTEIASKISGTANYSPWLYMAINADPNNVNNGETSLITASFNNYSTDGVTYTPLANPTLGHLPDGTPVAFNTGLGSFGGSKTIETLTSGGLATATFNADETAGSAVVSAVTDAQTVNLNVVINPKSSLYLNLTTNNTNPMVGDTVLYTLKVGNQGPDAAQDVVMTYVIPQGLEFSGATVDNGTYTYDASTRTITWTIGEVPVGDPYLWLSLRVAQAGHYLINPTLTTSTYDPTLNTNTQFLTVNAQAAVEPETVNAQTETKTVRMQKTGIPVNYLLLALLLVIGGYIVPKRK